MVMGETLGVASRDVGDRISQRFWDRGRLAEKLRSLRRETGLTQEELGRRAGITATAIRNYEFMKSSPKAGHLDKIAEALGVRPECLRLFDFGVDDQLASALFQLGDTYGLVPESHEGYACLVPTTPFMTGAIRWWTRLFRSLASGEITRDEYELAKDRYAAGYQTADFPSRLEEADGDETGELMLIEQWAAHCMSTALRRHRIARGMSQPEFAAMLGLSTGVYRSYEQGRRLPKKRLVEEIADRLGVTVGSLTFFDFGTPVQAIHALFQLAAQYGLVPDVIDGRPVLRTMSAGVEQIIDQWALALGGTYECAGMDVEYDGADLRTWMDRYEPDRRRNESEWTSRYRTHFARVSQGGMRPEGWESDYDPYDESIPGGHLMA